MKGPLRGGQFILGAAAGEGGGASIFFGLMEPEKTAALSSILSTGQVVFDIGANIGYYTVLASRVVGTEGRVLAFEPLTRNMAYLHRHVAINRARNVSLIAAACSDRTGLSLFLPGTDCATGSLTATPARQGSEVVATTTVDDVVRLTGAMPHVLKIDVEGAEVQVLKGAAQTLATARPAVLLGVHSEALRAECAGFLEGMGYEGRAVCDDANGDSEVLFTVPHGRPAPKR